MAEVDAEQWAAQVAAVADVLARAERVLFITGAGISADSGLPTYRGVNGLYNEQATDDGWAIEEALSGDMLRSRPEITWKYLFQIEAGCRSARPNPAHHALAEVERRKPGSMVLTQNIDGLHRDAGSRNLIEIHGNLHRLRCTGCSHRAGVSSYAGLPVPPVCPQCGSVVRPEVVLFGEALDRDDTRRLYAGLVEGFDVVFSIGTTSVFPYIVEPVAWALRAGVPTVEINPAETQISPHVQYRLPVGAAAALDAVMAKWDGGAG